MLVMHPHLGVAVQVARLEHFLGAVSSYGAHGAVGSKEALSEGPLPAPYSRGRNAVATRQAFSSPVHVVERERPALAGEGLLEGLPPKRTDRVLRSGIPAQVA